MRRRWTDLKKRRVLAYYDEHGHTATLKKYKISGSMLHHWQEENGTKKERKKPKSVSQVHDAIIYLEKAADIGENQNANSLKQRLMYALVILALDSLKG